MSRYDPKTIEPKWQLAWDEQRAFRTPSDLPTLQTKPKFYVLDMFPYPSGAGLHVGHPEGYTATDVVARLKRMTGHWVLHPMGWDAFGLPAERAAVREGIHPAIITKRNIDNFRRQIKTLGFSYDWEREVDTSSPDYYRFTQWIFLQLHKKGLAEMAEVAVNWCPALATVLANEEVKDGKYTETGDVVERRSMKQWMLKIPAYAERLLEDLCALDWPEGVKEMQRNWIGKSEGADVRFDIIGSEGLSFTVFTTRPDTLYGATYAVLAPEHPLVDKITTPEHRERVALYVQATKQKNDLLRTDLAKEKSGVPLGAFANNPATGENIPLWIADYVLMSYGTGAIMAVPAHDERDHAFAVQMGLPIRQVVLPLEGDVDVQATAFTDAGKSINSGPLDGRTTADAKRTMIELIESAGYGKRQVHYKLRDWLFSRQRYWGEPFPVVHTDDGEIVFLAPEDLPVELPAIDEYKPTSDGRPPLARAPESWLRVRLKDGRMGTRETNTMPQWAGSCWYYLRYIDPKNTSLLVGKQLEQYWMPVDLYVGGVEHAVLHLLYARFWHKVLFDAGVVSTTEPFFKLFNQGMILAHSFTDAKGKYFDPADATDIDSGKGKAKSKSTGVELNVQIEKMSKSRFNVVSPDDVVRDYGADSLRLYELFMGPLEQVKPWQMAGVEGVARFLARTWRLVVDEETDALRVSDTRDDALMKSLHKTIKKVKDDTEALRFNTAIAQMMTFVNEATHVKALPRDIMLTFCKLLSPYAPHIAEELWARLGQQGLVCTQPWPAHDDKLLVDDRVTLGVQVNGKRRDEIVVPKDADDATVTAAALASPAVQKFMEGKPAKKVIVVKGRMVSVVT
jgi:leucyl-tRNA synthetase